MCRYSDLSSCAIAPRLLPFGVEFVRKEEEVSPFLTSGVQKAGGVAVARMFEPDQPVGGLGVSVVVVVQGDSTPSI